MRWRQVAILREVTLVPKGGLEPPRVTSHAPQTCASTSSATSAHLERLSKNSQSVWIASATSSESLSVSVLATETEQVAESWSAMALALPSAREFRIAKLNWCH